MPCCEILLCKKNITGKLRAVTIEIDETKFAVIRMASWVEETPLGALLELFLDEDLWQVSFFLWQ